MDIETVEQLAEYKTVQKWLKGVHHQSPASTTTDEDRLRTLLKFCQLAEKDPDTIIEECFRAPKEGDEWKHIKFKVRRSYSALIDQAQEELLVVGLLAGSEEALSGAFSFTMECPCRPCPCVS